jgi:hypothetical protein
MKKSSLKQRLALVRTTVRTMSSDQLEGVQGGFISAILACTIRYTQVVTVDTPLPTPDAETPDPA